MKKIITVMLAVLMVFAISIPVFAADNNFITSPGKNTPEIVDVDTDIPDYNGRIIIVPYPKKDTLPTGESKLMEDAYGDISGKDGNSNLQEVLDGIGTGLGIVDLFNLHETGAATNNNGTYTVTMSVEGKNAKSLIYMDEDGVWHVVDNAKISSDGKTLTFTTKTLSVPYALVGTKTGTSPKSGQNIDLLVYTVIISGIAVTFLAFSKVRVG